MKNETPIQSDIIFSVGSRRDARIFRNNNGTGYQGKKIRCRDRVVILSDFRIIKFGLGVGSGDGIGWKSVEITPDMVGRRVAIFLSLEVKTPEGRASDEQINWRDRVVDAGGIAGFARSSKEANEIIDAWGKTND